jgi:uncharacterized damage-inducible protein DinB
MSRSTSPHVLIEGLFPLSMIIPPRRVRMTGEEGQRLLDMILDSWDRNNAILVNLLRALPKGALTARALATSPSVAEMFTHMYHERMVSVLENAPEFAGNVPEREWVAERDSARIELQLHESASRVRAAVKGRVEAGENMDLDFAHPIHLLQLLIFHEGYHHGQIKLALKAAGCPISDKEIGPVTWGVWRQRQ